MMKSKNIIAAFLLITGGSQTAWAQKVLIYKTNNTTIELKTNEVDSMVFVPAEAAPTPSFLTCPDDHHPHAIDLGLPSGTKWACCNVGAKRPEDYGDYFAWGETKPKTSYSWSTYFDTDDGGSTFQKYYNNGGKTELDPENDAATANWDTGWQMPSEDQMEELINSNYTTMEWTTQDGVNGRKITSKSHGNCIFLPAAGYLSTESIRKGSYGYYWSRSLKANRSDYAYDIRFYSGINDSSDDGSRYFGQSVRPVRK